MFIYKSKDGVIVKTSHLENNDFFYFESAYFSVNCKRRSFLYTTKMMLLYNKNISI